MKNPAESCRRERGNDPARWSCPVIVEQLRMNEHARPQRHAGKQHQRRPEQFHDRPQTGVQCAFGFQDQIERAMNTDGDQRGYRTKDRVPVQYPGMRTRPEVSPKRNEEVMIRAERYASHYVA